MKEKDAEIERLKTARESDLTASVLWISSLRALITELADALESKACFGFEYNDLIQRAREATKDE